MEDAITIPQEEKAQVKEQILQGMRRKYLSYKAEYLANLATGKDADAQRWLALMNDTVTSYERVEADL